MLEFLLALDKARSFQMVNKKFIKYVNKTVDEFLSLSDRDNLINYLESKDLSDEMKLDIIKVSLEKNNSLRVRDLVYRDVISIDLYMQGDRKREETWKRFWQRFFR